MFERYVDFCKTHQPKNEMVEAHMISQKLGFAGTIDRVIEMNGKYILMDIKTSNSIYPSYWLQLAAYNELIKELNIECDQVAILWLNAKTRTTGKNGAIQGVGWQLVSRDMKEVKKDYKLFKSTYELWKFMNEDIKPRELSYQLTHKK